MNADKWLSFICWLCAVDEWLHRHIGWLDGWRPRYAFCQWVHGEYFVWVDVIENWEETNAHNNPVR